MPSTRRAFLATSGLAAAAGCVARGSDTPAYQIVAGVEWKTLRGTRDDTVKKIAQNGPVDGPVGDDAPTGVNLRTVSYDDAVVDLSGDGPLRLADSKIDRLESGYDDPYGVIVLTLYNRDPYNEVPKGNSYGYRCTLAQFDRVDPGDRISATVDRARDVAALDEILTVDEAETR